MPRVEKISLKLVVLLGLTCQHCTLLVSANDEVVPPSVVALPPVLGATTGPGQPTQAPAVGTASQGQVFPGEGTNDTQVERVLTYRTSMENKKALEELKQNLQTCCSVKAVTKADLETRTKALSEELQTKLRTEVDELQEALKTLKENSRTIYGIGVAYTLWGRIDCTPGTERLYTGHMVGSTKYGGGSGFLCLADDMENAMRSPAVTNLTNTFVSLVDGIEMKLHPEPPVGGEKLWGWHDNPDEDLPTVPLTSQDLLCAVCYRPGASTQIMIPGKKTCTKKQHNLEYSGFLVGGRSANSTNRLHVQREYICLSQTLEANPGGAWDSEESGEVVPVRIHCGALPCSTFASTHLPCSVCTL